MPPKQQGQQQGHEENVPPQEKAKELGATIPYEGRIGWVWSIGFPNKEVGERFIEWLEQNGYDHRGIYSNVDGTCDVRWRKSR